MVYPDSVQERFWSRVEKTDTCWLWTRALHHGYGSFCHAGKTQKAHRVAYEMVVGSVPEGLVLDHLCRVRNCVNPDHLEPVTTAENVFRGIGPTAKNRVKTHCKRGHEFTPDNIRPKNRNGHRECMTCLRAWWKQDNEKKKKKRRLYRLENPIVRIRDEKGRYIG